MQTVVEDSLIILDTVPEAYFRFDSMLRLTFVNQAAETLLGTTRAKLLGKMLWDVCSEPAEAPLEEACRRTMAERIAVSVDHCFKWRSRCYEATSRPDSSGGIVVQFSDITDRKLMEDALWKSEEKFSKAFQSSPIPMCIVDVDKNSSFMEVNEAFETITGYKSNEIIGRTSTDLGLYVDVHDLEESRRRLLAHGGYRNLEVRFRTRSGDVVTGLISAEQIEIGGSLCAIAAAVDVTENRRSEKALRESEELYRQLFELESDAIVIVDRNSGQLLAANQAAIRLYGYSREELLSMNRTDLSAEPQETIRATMGMKPFTPLRWHKQKNGTIFPVEIASCYFPLRGRSVFVSAIRDITDRSLMEEALKKSEEKFSKAFHSNPAAIVIRDLNTKRYLEVNAAFEQMIGYRRDEVVGHGWEELPMWTDPNERFRADTQLVRDGVIRNWEFGFRRKNGDLGTGLLSAEVINLDGKPCAIASMADISERHQLESQLRQAQKLESLGRLAGGVAHDFNNLLTIINGYSDLMLKAMDPHDPLYSKASEVNKAGERAAGLTGQLLAFSRKQVIEPRALDVNGVVKDTERMLQRLIGEDVELVTVLDPFVGQVMADPGLIHQVIMNLVVNARDAMPNGGKLTIATNNVEIDESTAGLYGDKGPGEYVVITVSDTGIGMDAETQTHIFEPFFTTKERGRGTGLGLSTVHGIVQQSGGWIRVWSVVEQGTSFDIYLPRILWGLATSRFLVVVQHAVPPVAGLGGIEDPLLLAGRRRPVVGQKRIDVNRSTRIPGIPAKRVAGLSGP
jgi:PAS domain S-box-containing protein